MVTRRQRVLIVDDYAPSRIAVTNGLARRGYACAGATSARDAIAMVGALRPDVVVAEWAFRDGSGAGLAIRLRLVSENWRMIVIALSHANEPAELYGQFDAYLVKPASPDEIERAFTRHTRMQRAG
jgi:CheY-like chemotaxis protein